MPFWPILKRRDSVPIETTDSAGAQREPTLRERMSRRWWRHQRRLAPLILLAPASVMFFVFVIYPIGQSLVLSLFEWTGYGPKKFVGLRHFVNLTHDPVARTALANNLIWVALYFLAPVCGLLLAMFLNRDWHGIRVIRALFLLPFVISQVVVGLIFSWFLNPDFGLFNRLLELLDVSPVAPLADENWAIVAVVIAGLWPQTAYCMILFLTGLTGLRQEQIDAGRIDGARGLTLLWHVVLPQLRPVTFIAVMVCIVGALRSFDLVTIMTGGGPYDSSTVLAYYMYEQSFFSLRYGYGAAIATVLFALMASCVGVFLWRMLRQERQ